VRVMALTEKEGGLVRSLREEGVRRLRRVEALWNEEESEGGDERDKDVIVDLFEDIQFNSILYPTHNTTQHFSSTILSHLICVWLVFRFRLD